VSFISDVWKPAREMVLQKIYWIQVFNDCTKEDDL